MKSRLEEVVFLTIVTAHLLVAILDSQILTPAFPEMIREFNTDEKGVQSLITFNFITLCVGSLFVGPISDAIGRKNGLLLGVTLYLIGSIGCLVSHSIDGLILWRLLQGLGVAASMITAGTAVFDAYENKKAGRRIALSFSIVYTLVSLGLAGASFLVDIYGWKAPIIAIALLSFLTLLLTLFCFKETLDKANYSKLSILVQFRKFKKLVSSFDYVGPVLITSFMYTALLFYIANASIIFIKHMGVDQKVFGLYPMAVTMSLVLATFVLSLMNENRFDLDKVKKAGLFMSVAGCISMVILEVFGNSTPLTITVNMCIIIGGTGLSFSLFIADLMKVFPEHKGSSSSIAIFIRLIIAAPIIRLGGEIFDGTIRPVATIVCVLIFASLALYYLLERRKQAH